MRNISKTTIHWPFSTKLEVKYLTGNPRAIFYDANGTEIERVDISALDELQIHALLEERGIMRDNV